MDLSKAKSILILAFLCLNIFLGYRLWLSPQALRQGSVLSRNELIQAEELLLENGFELSTSIPKQIPQLAMLHVSRPQQQAIFWVNTFMANEEVSLEIQQDRRVYKSHNKTLELTENGQVIYTAEMDGSGAEPSRSLAESYLQDWDLWSNDMKLDLVIPALDGMRYRFIQTFQGFPLFFSRIEVYLKNGIPVEVQIEQATPLQFSERVAIVISAMSALENFVEEAVHFPNKRIIDISLGYFSGNYDAKRLETTPVWRILTADGVAFYLNAFTGEREESN